MKCIDDELVQRYIDSETDFSETKQIEKHIAVCSSCANRIEERKALANAIKADLQTLGSPLVTVPEFSVPVIQKRRLKFNPKHIIYAVSAACVILGMLLLQPTERQEEDEENKMLIMYSVIRDFDANRTFSQQETSIFMIDGNGKIIEFY